MNINRMTDEELAKELDRHFDVEPEQLIEVAQFIRRCVKDSRNELREALKALYNDTTRPENWAKAKQTLVSVEGKDSHVA